MDISTATPVEIDTELARIGPEMTKQNRAADNAYQCGQIASVRLRNLYVCRECAEWLRSIGVM